MTLTDIGTYGATAQSWRRNNPRPLLEQLMDESPDPRTKANRAELFTAFRDMIRGDDGEEYFDAIIEYWFTNNYNRLIDEKYTKPKTPAEQRAAKQAERAKVEKIKATIKVRAERMVLLDMVLPNGKALRQCTGKECAKAGGWFAKIAGQVKPNEIVGAILSEAQVRKLYA